MDIILIIFVALMMLLVLYAYIARKKGAKTLLPFPETYRAILNEQVSFYQQLDAERKNEFEKRLQIFLSQVRITGIKTTVDDIDKVLIAASAIIPIFGFPGWQYVNLHEVLLYPGSFNHAFEQQGPDRNTLGLVGNGPYQHVMILSKKDLREGFENKDGKSNTAIHEFVHLVDKTDGSVDGIPEFILGKQYILPWLQLMQQEIKQILENRSDINPYGATNQAEFFAVVSEYFFEQPDLLKSNHPELYELLATIFKQQTQSPSKNKLTTF